MNEGAYDPDADLARTPSDQGLEGVVPLPLEGWAGPEGDEATWAEENRRMVALLREARGRKEAAHVPEDAGGVGPA